LQPFLPRDIARIGSIQPGSTVLVFALVLSLAAVLAFGLGPALLATPSTVPTNINDGGERTGQSGGRLGKRGLAVAEISLAIVLLIGSGLLIRSLALVTSVHPGFDPEGVIEAEISLPRFL